jgi:hypothetical protein
MYLGMYFTILFYFISSDVAKVAIIHKLAIKKIWNEKI